MSIIENIKKSKTSSRSISKNFSPYLDALPYRSRWLQLIFDESQKEGNNESWIDLYPLTKFLAKYTQAVVKVEETKEWAWTTRILDPAVKEYEAGKSGEIRVPADEDFFGEEQAESDAGQ